MSREGRAFVTRVAIGVGVTAGIAAVVWSAGYRYNETASLPVGIWRIHTAANLQAGTIVNFCPPPNAILMEGRRRDYLANGPCPGGLESMFKPIVALSGDRVALTAHGVTVNGALVPNSTPAPHDGLGRTLPVPADQTVPVGFVWLVSSYSADSFDSRYFGPVAVASIIGTADPIFVKEAP